MYILKREEDKCCPLLCGDCPFPASQCGLRKGRSRKTGLHINWGKGHWLIIAEPPSEKMLSKRMLSGWAHEGQTQGPPEEGEGESHWYTFFSFPNITVATWALHTCTKLPYIIWPVDEGHFYLILYMIIPNLMDAGREPKEASCVWIMHFVLWALEGRIIEGSGQQEIWSWIPYLLLLWPWPMIYSFYFLLCMYWVLDNYYEVQNIYRKNIDPSTTILTFTYHTEKQNIFQTPDFPFCYLKTYVSLNF